MTGSDTAGPRVGKTIRERTSLLPGYCASSGHLATVGVSSPDRPGGRYWEWLTGYLGGNKPLHRLYLNEGVDHFYTTSWNEVLTAISHGYTNEGDTGSCW